MIRPWPPAFATALLAGASIRLGLDVVTPVLIGASVGFAALGTYLRWSRS